MKTKKFKFKIQDAEEIVTVDPVEEIGDEDEDEIESIEEVEEDKIHDDGEFTPEEVADLKELLAHKDELLSLLGGDDGIEEISDEDPEPVDETVEEEVSEEIIDTKKYGDSVVANAKKVTKTKDSSQSFTDGKWAEFYKQHNK